MALRSSTIQNRLQEPGALRGGAVLALHSRHAAWLVRGRPGTQSHSAILGLFGFARALRPIYDGADEHDPYAHWWQQKVGIELGRANDVLGTLKAALSTAMTPESGFATAEATSERPVVVELRFACAYAYSAAKALADFDRLAVQALSSRHVGLVSGDVADKIIDRGGRALRRLFLTPVGYRRTGVLTADIRVDNRVARRARELMGLLPDDLPVIQAGEKSLSIGSDPSKPAVLGNLTVLTAAQ